MPTDLGPSRRSLIERVVVATTLIAVGSTLLLPVARREYLKAHATTDEDFAALGAYIDLEDGWQGWEMAAAYRIRMNSEPESWWTPQLVWAWRDFQAAPSEETLRLWRFAQADQIVLAARSSGDPIELERAEYSADLMKKYASMPWPTYEFMVENIEGFGE